MGQHTIRFAYKTIETIKDFLIIIIIWQTVRLDLQQAPISSRWRDNSKPTSMMQILNPLHYRA